VAQRRDARARRRRAARTVGGSSTAVAPGTPLLPVSFQRPGARDMTERRLPVPRGRARAHRGPDADDHLRDLIEQVLFTAPGERVMRPDFGSGLLGLVFEPGGPGARRATQHSSQGALQRELGT
jgi:hypothetical protein